MKINDGLKLEPSPLIGFSPKVTAEATRIAERFFRGFLREKYGKWRHFKPEYWKLRLFTRWL